MSFRSRMILALLRRCARRALYSKVRLCSTYLVLHLFALGLSSSSWDLRIVIIIVVSI